MNRNMFRKVLGLELVLTRDDLSMHVFISRGCKRIKFGGEALFASLLTVDYYKMQYVSQLLHTLPM